MSSTGEILTAELVYQEPASVPIARRMAAAQARGYHLALPADSETTEGMTVAARVEHGRWLVDCPFCRGALLASSTDPRFLCADCFNRAISGQMIEVVWPKQRAAIEAELLRRERDENRNWLPGETVDDLIREREAALAGEPAIITPSRDDLLAALLGRIEALEQARAQR